LQYIPPSLQKDWANAPGNYWDRFFHHFYVAGRSEKVKDIADLQPAADWL
jgi:hypothetical protein